jgi:hypothetical protein
MVKQTQLNETVAVRFSLHLWFLSNFIGETEVELGLKGTLVLMPNFIQSYFSLGYVFVCFLSSRLLSRNVKVKIYKTIILPVVFYGCETWSLTLREEYRLRVFENRVLRRIFGPKKDEVTGECCTMRSFIFCTPPQILLGRSNQGE